MRFGVLNPNQWSFSKQRVVEVYKVAKYGSYILQILSYLFWRETWGHITLMYCKKVKIVIFMWSCGFLKIHAWIDTTEKSILITLKDFE